MICEKCGTEFGPNMPHQRFCSQLCKKRARACRKEAAKWRRNNPPLVPKRCIACDELFVPRRGRVQACCSTHCRYMVQWASYRSIKRCPCCKREFLAKGGQEFCMGRCRDWTRRFERLEDDGSTVYFVRAESGPIKIGRTSDDMRNRLSIIQTGNHEKLVLLGTITGGVRREVELHRQFARYRIRGEWFQPVPELLAIAAGKPQLELVA